MRRNNGKSFPHLDPNKFGSFSTHRNKKYNLMDENNGEKEEE
jgi:hypothetical protein